MDYLQHMKLRLAGEEPSVPSWLWHKRAVREFARNVGVQTAEVYYRGPISGLPASPAPRFVLKPEFGSTSIGVLLLSDNGNGTFRNCVTGDIHNSDEIRMMCTTVAEKFLGTDKVEEATFVAEELLVGVDGSTPPADIRCYAFQGDIGLILMEHHIAGPATAMYFDGLFHPLKNVHEKYSIDERVAHLESIAEAVPPANASAILNVARRISVAIPSAFCRIDLYDTMGGVVLGELTFTPGTFYYENRKLMSSQESERLGLLWDYAASRLE